MPVSIEFCIITHIGDGYEGQAKPMVELHLEILPSKLALRLKI